MGNVTVSRTYRIGTRQSQLAQIQARRVGDALKAQNPGSDYELVFITTTGDKFMGDLAQVGGKEAFVKEIDEAVLSGHVDFAVHSMKDVPTEMPNGLAIVATLLRNDIRDVAVCRKGMSFSTLKAGAKVGTSSVRRAAQLKAMFPYLDVQPVRGNVNSRLEKLDKGEYDALILAKAGLDLLGFTARITDVFEPDMMCPAVAQGAIGIVCRDDDKDLAATLAPLGDADTLTCVLAEREMLRGLGGSCHTPIAGYVVVTANRNLRLIGLVADPDGRRILRVREKMPFENALELGRKCAEDLLNQGAGDIIHELARSA